MATAIFDSNNFSPNTVDIANGESTLTDTGSINIVLSTGVNQPVFHSLSTAFKCSYLMTSRHQYLIMAGDDVTIINCQTQILIFENACIKQTCIRSYDVSYHGKTVKAIQKNLNTLLNLTDARITVGFKVSSSVSWNTSGGLETNFADSDRPRVKLVDWFYFTTQGSLFSDTTQIVFIQITQLVFIIVLKRRRL